MPTWNIQLLNVINLLFVFYTYDNVKYSLEKKIIKTSIKYMDPTKS